MSNIELLGTTLGEHATKGVLTVGELVRVLLTLNQEAEIELDICAKDHRHYSISDVVSIDDKQVLIYSGHLTAILSEEEL